MRAGVVSAADILAQIGDEDDAWRPQPLPCDLMTPAVAAGVLGVAVTTVKQMGRVGLLRGTKTMGGHRRFYADSVLALRDLREARRRATGAPSPGPGTAHAAPPICGPSGRRH